MLLQQRLILVTGILHASIAVVHQSPGRPALIQTVRGVGYRMLEAESGPKS